MTNSTDLPMTPKILTAAEILAADDLVRMEVHVPEWGGTVLVKSLTGRERDQWEASFVNIGDDGETRLNKTAVTDNVKARLCVLCMVDERGKRLFKDSDAEALGQKSAAAISRVFDVASRLNRVSDDDIEELAGN